MTERICYILPFFAAVCVFRVYPRLLQHLRPIVVFSTFLARITEHPVAMHSIRVRPASRCRFATQARFASKSSYEGYFEDKKLMLAHVAGRNFRNTPHWSSGGGKMVLCANTLSNTAICFLRSMCVRRYRATTAAWYFLCHCLGRTPPQVCSLVCTFPQSTAGGYTRFSCIAQTWIHHPSVRENKEQPHFL